MTPLPKKDWTTLSIDDHEDQCILIQHVVSTHFFAHDDEEKVVARILWLN